MADIEHKVLPNAELHEPKDINTAAVNTVYTADGIGSGSWQLLAGQLTETVIVKAESDLPVPSGGVIQLENKEYIFSGIVSIANALNFPATGGCFLTGENHINDGINYTGSVDLFTGTGFTAGFAVMENLLIKAPTGTVYNVIAGSNAFMLAVFCVFNDVSSMGNVSNCGCTFMFSSVTDYGDGIQLTSNAGATVGRMFFDQGKNSANSDMVKISGTHKTIQINSNFFVTAGANERVFNIEASSTTTGAIAVGNAIDTVAGGTAFRSGSKNETDVSWQYQANSNLGPSRTIGGYLVKNNAAATVITTQNVWTDLNLNALAIALSTEERFTLTNTTTGEFRYDGLEAFRGLGITTLSCVATASAQEYHFRFIKNGAVTADAAESVRDIATDTGEITVMSPLSLVTNDLVRIQVLNADGTDNITVQFATVNIQ